MSDIMTAADEEELHESCGHISPSFIKTSGVGFILAASRGPSQQRQMKYAGGGPAWQSSKPAVRLITSSAFEIKCRTVSSRSFRNRFSCASK